MFRTYTTLEGDELLVDFAHTHGRLDKVLDRALVALFHNLVTMLRAEDEIEEVVVEGMHLLRTVQMSKVLTHTEHVLYKLADTLEQARVRACVTVTLLPFLELLEGLLEGLLGMRFFVIEGKRGVLELANRFAELAEVGGGGEG
jgi:hypothetical protein